MLRTVLLAFAASVVVTSTALAQGTLFHRAQDLHDYGRMPSLQSFPYETTWTGTCVFASNPNYDYSGAAHFLYQQTHPHQRPQLFVIDRFSDKSIADYNTIHRSQIHQLQQDARRFLPITTPVSGEQDPLATGLVFHLQENQTRIDMNLRESWSEDGRPLYSLKATCGSHVCQDAHGQMFRYGEVAKYCYYWNDRFAQY